MSMNKNLKKLVIMGVLTAISTVLIMIIRFPIIPAAPFMEYEPSNIPIAIGGLIFGPISGIILAVITAFIQFATVSAGSGWIGLLMHVIASVAHVSVSASVYKFKKTTSGLIVGLVLGTIAMTAVMIPANLIFYPLFTGMPVSAVKELIVPVLLPFNLIKAGLNSVVTFTIFKAIGKLLTRIANNQSY